jgi:hypothetical protein
LVENVFRTVATNGSTVSGASREVAVANRLPDLVVHWSDAAFSSPLRIRDSQVQVAPVGRSTGQHALEGFCIYKGARRDVIKSAGEGAQQETYEDAGQDINSNAVVENGGVIAAHYLGQLIVSSL